MLLMYETHMQNRFVGHKNVWVVVFEVGVKWSVYISKHGFLDCTYQCTSDWAISDKFGDLIHPDNLDLFTI